MGRAGGDSSREVLSDDSSVHANAACSAGNSPGMRRSSLKKASSESSIPKTVETSVSGLATTPAIKGDVGAKKSVSFSQEVLSQGNSCSLLHPEREESFLVTAVSSQAVLSTRNVRDATSNNGKVSGATLCSEGVVIKNGSEIKDQEREADKSQVDSLKENQQRTNKAEQNDRAKIIAKVKAATRCSCIEEQCPCRHITRPTMGVISDVKAGKVPGGRLLVRHHLLLSDLPLVRLSILPTKFMHFPCVRLGEFGQEFMNFKVKYKAPSNLLSFIVNFVMSDISLEKLARTFRT